MSDEFSFRFSISGLPQGEALMGSEGERRLLKDFEDSGGTNLDALWSLASLYQIAGRPDQAEACVRKYIELAKDLEDLGAARLALGQLQETKGDYVAAARCYREALIMEPCSTQTWYLIHNNLGFSLNQTGDSAAAIPYLQQALRIDPTRPNAYKNLGLAHQALDDPIAAAEMFIAGTQVEASDPRSLNHLLALIEVHPHLEVDIPDLRGRVEACKKAVALAAERQPDFHAHWAKLRSQQKRKWWQFWKRR